MERGSRKRSSSAGGEKIWWQIGKNGRTLFDRQKPAAGCSASGRRRAGLRENIVKWIKRQRISWLGHLERMEEGRMPKNIFTQELEGTRRRGKDSGKDGKRK